MKAISNNRICRIVPIKMSKDGAKTYVAFGFIKKEETVPEVDAGPRTTRSHQVLQLDLKTCIS